MLNDTEVKTINYLYKGEIKTAKVSVSTSPKMDAVYWFNWRTSGPTYLTKVNGEWVLNGTKPLNMKCDKGEIYLALATAIDEQLIQQ